ncbi:Uu.00g090130.m01.CDS01 [Anthostomella pinea]|uniref:Uu.00g090130.m01.CDS01 n=1 Tax=Anthostomella pinea TaxID=933095 RepID=A0AAI8VNI0_9PEZI|nr:Uu.00g090130.m01.CDS01 [Anthostomella pinea]
MGKGGISIQHAFTALVLQMTHHTVSKADKKPLQELQVAFNLLELTNLNLNIKVNVFQDPTAKRARKKDIECEHHELLKLNPVLCGVLLLSIRSLYHSVCISFTNSWGVTLRATHLYKYAQDLKNLDSVWGDVEVLSQTQAHNAIFAGRDTPPKAEECFRRYLMATGASAVVFTHNRRIGVDPRGNISEEHRKKLRPKAQVSSAISGFSGSNRNDQTATTQGLRVVLEKGTAPEDCPQQMKRTATTISKGVLQALESTLKFEAQVLQVNLLKLHRQS